MVAQHPHQFGEGPAATVRMVTCPRCSARNVVLTPQGRLTLHTEPESRKKCQATGLLPDDAA
jgi:hypothetical protein